MSKIIRLSCPGNKIQVSTSGFVGPECLEVSEAISNRTGLSQTPGSLHLTEEYYAQKPPPESGSTYTNEITG